MDTCLPSQILERHQAPVTALSLWQDEIVLAGEGPILNAYNVRTRLLLASVSVLQDQQIQGIITVSHSDYYALVWGRQSICKVVIKRDFDNGLLTFQPAPTHQVIDWIMDVAVAPLALPGYEPLAAILTAHNALTLWDLGEHSRLDVQLSPVIPGSNCILYSAHIKWLSPFNCLLAAGTAFGDVIVWSCIIDRKDGHVTAEAQTHYVFSAHEGSVFGVQISSDDVAAAVDGRQHVLASCSDDRSIRLWDISDLSSTSPSLIDIQRETGFGEKETQDDYSPPFLSKIMGHSSRIWHVTFSIDRSEQHALDQIRIVSFGEDASYIIWGLERCSSDIDVYTFKQLRVQRLHNGKNIWSSAIDDKTGIVVTGGADGAVSLSSLLSTTNSHEMQLPVGLSGSKPSEITEGKVGQLLNNSFSSATKGDAFRVYDFVRPDELVATTDRGNVVWFNGVDQFLPHGAHLNDIGLRSYSVMNTTSGIVFVGGFDGRVHVCTSIDASGPKTFVQLLKTDRKVTGLFSQLLSDDTHGCRIVALVVANIKAQTATFVTLRLELKASAACSELDISMLSQCEIELPVGFVVTSSALWKQSSDLSIALGSRTGSIAMYEIVVEQTGRILPCATFQKIHGKESVTSLNILEHSGKHHARKVLFSTGRDGTYAAHSVASSSGSVHLETIHQLSLPFGPNIEGLGLSRSGDLWVWGFRNLHFVVYNVATELEVFAIECGGVHRVWAFQIHDDGGTFVWTKGTKVYSQVYRESSSKSITSGGHGRDIKAMAVSSRVIATGSEDTNIKLTIHDKGKIVTVHTLQKHNTGIQHLQWSDDGEYLFSSGGFEELFIWKLTPNVPAVHVGVIRESAHPNSGRSDLRITAFHAKSSPPEHPKAFTFTTLYSDSSIKIWSYTQQKWSLLSTGTYLTACPTACLNFPSSNFFLTANTDGHLVTWRAPSISTSANSPALSLSWLSRHQLHRNAILSTTHHTLSDSSILVLTGGDDNSISISRWPSTLPSASSENSAPFPAPAILRIPRAHAAAVTGLVVFPDPRDPDKIRMVSAGIDQRVKIWDLRVDVKREGVEGVEVRKKKGRGGFTGVADVSSMEKIRLGEDGEVDGVVIVGVGVEVRRVEGLHGEV